MITRICSEEIRHTLVRWFDGFECAERQTQFVYVDPIHAHGCLALQGTGCVGRTGSRGYSSLRTDQSYRRLDRYQTLTTVV